MTRTRLALLGAGVALLLLRHRREEERRLTERMAAAALEALLNAIEANDHATGEHLRRTAAYALILARALGLGTRAQHSVERVALFHDIGKLHSAVADIVHEATRLSPEERRLIATHPARGADVLGPLCAFYPELPEGILSHHERWDGTGYPRRLRGAQIPLTARIVAIADTFDAITHQRRYRPASSLRTALDVIARGRGTQFDPQLVDLFLSAPVRRAVRRAMRESYRAPGPVHAKRRGERVEESIVPDIMFRWRPATRAPSAPGRPRRTRRGSPPHRSPPPR
ncbi:MAG TPA: HD domain-containing phosphohydrolase [Gemmatimonadaceae bacterium]